MSRTIKGSKYLGYDFWSARPGNKLGANGCSTYAKIKTHRAERRIAKRDVRKELMEDWPSG